MTLALSLYASLADASVIYQWVCGAPDCDGDTAFTSSIEITDSAFAAGSFIGVAGNVLSWNTHQGFGGGYDFTLANIASFLQDDVNLSITLSADRSVISALYDISAGTNITFADAPVAQHRVDFIEGTLSAFGYKVDPDRDLVFQRTV